MAKTSMVEREKKRLALVAKYYEKRKALSERGKDASLSDQERWAAQVELQKMPRDASRCRLRSRCSITGRAHGVYKKFGLGRNKLREFAMKGDLPGLTKASW
jgi:small subunit ribosomal protein S14